MFLKVQFVVAAIKIRMRPYASYALDIFMMEICVSLVAKPVLNQIVMLVVDMSLVTLSAINAWGIQIAIYVPTVLLWAFTIMELPVFFVIMLQHFTSALCAAGGLGLELNAKIVVLLQMKQIV